MGIILRPLLRLLKSYHPLNSGHSFTPHLEAGDSVRPFRNSTRRTSSDVNGVVDFFLPFAPYRRLSVVHRSRHKYKGLADWSKARVRFLYVSLSPPTTISSDLPALLQGSGWAGTFHFIDPTTGIAAILGTQCIPALDRDVMKLSVDLEKVLYEGLV